MTPDSSQGLVLIVDDDAEEATVLITALSAAGYRVHHRTDSLAGLEAVEEEEPVVVVLDWGLPFINGATFVWALHVGLPTPPPVIALIDGTADPEQVRGRGVQATLRRPLDPAELVRAVANLVASSDSPHHHIA